MLLLLVKKTQINGAVKVDQIALGNQLTYTPELQKSPKWAISPSS